MALPVTPPVTPMLASPVAEIPERADLLFEPKWDGFRCLVFVDPAATEPVFLQSRTGKSLNRYFPEVLARLAKAIPVPAVLDGEIVVARSDNHGDLLDWNALSERIHPAESRVKLLAEQTPAQFIAFDLLAWQDRTLLTSAFRQRRQLLEAGEFDQPGFRITPMTTDAAKAREWFEHFEGAGVDGVIAKKADGPYQPGKRAMYKIKHTRTADCVVAGLRWHANTTPGTAVGSLLLGLYDEQGILHHVGVVGAFSAAQRRTLAEQLAGYLTEGEHPWKGDQVQPDQRIPGAETRWRKGELVWQPLRPELVVEVGYDHTEGQAPSRFRHTTQFVRWRPDRDPASCGYAQLAEPRRYDLDAIFSAPAT